MSNFGLRIAKNMRRPIRWRQGYTSQVIITVIILKRMRWGHLARMGYVRNA